MSNQENLKNRVESVLSSLNNLSNCSPDWCNLGCHRIIPNCTPLSHVCSFGLSLYVFLRHLLEGTSSYLRIHDVLVTEQTFSNSPHMLIFFKDGSFCIYGQHLKGMISSEKYPFFCGLLLVLLYRLAETGQYPNSQNLLRLIPQSLIDSVLKILSDQKLIENNDLKTLKLPANEKDEDRLLIIFYSAFKNDFKVTDDKYITYVNGDRLFFEPGNILSFRGASYFYYIRSVFSRLLESMGSIQQAESDDPDFQQSDVSDDEYD